MALCIISMKNLKRRAKKIARERSRPHHLALELAANELGFQTFKGAYSALIGGEFAATGPGPSEQVPVENLLVGFPEDLDQQSQTYLASILPSMNSHHVHHSRNGIEVLAELHKVLWKYL